jgi:ribosome maturation factor RimP
MTPFEARLSNLIEPSLEGLGYELVRVQLRGDTRKTLQIMAERKDLVGMTLDDCETISETLSAILDVHDPIKERYALEVSSPGIDRPLIKPNDYARFAGFEAKIDLKDLYENRRHLKGHLVAANDDTVTIRLEDGIEFAAPFAMIQRAKLLLTDELIEAHLKAQQDIQPINQEPVSIETDTTANEV